MIERVYQVFCHLNHQNLHQPKGVPTPHFSSTIIFQRGAHLLFIQEMPNLNGSNDKQPLQTLSIIYSINPRGCPLPTPSHNFSRTWGTYFSIGHILLGTIYHALKSLISVYEKTKDLIFYQYSFEYATVFIDHFNKAELLQEGIFFLLQIFARDVLVMKKLEIEKTKPTSIISTFKTDIIKVGLVFSISNFFIAKTSLANNWRSFSSSYLALVSLKYFDACHLI